MFNLKVFALTLMAATLSFAEAEIASNKLLTLSADGSVSVAPNKASFQINLECQNLKIKKTRACIIKKSDQLNKLIQSFGIPAKNIMTNSVNLHKEFNWKHQKKIFKGYKATMGTRVVVKNLNKLEKLYSKLLTEDKINLGRLEYGHTKIDSLGRVAYARALKNANQLADVLITEMGSSSKEISRVSNSSLSPGPRPQPYQEKRLGIVAEMSSNDSGPTVTMNQGQINVRRSLIVEFIVK